MREEHDYNYDIYRDFHREFVHQMMNTNSYKKRKLCRTIAKELGITVVENNEDSTPKYAYGLFDGLLDLFAK